METAAAERWRSPGRLAAWAGLVLFLIALGYGSRLEGGDPPDDALYRYETAIGGIVVYGLLLLLLLAIARGLPKREFFALRAPASWSRSLGLALVAYVVIFVGAGLLLVALDAGDEQGLTPDDWDSGRAGAYAANFVAVAFIGPLVEELLYRGAGMTLLLPFGIPLAVAVTAAGFGLGHGLLLALPALVFFGVVIAALRLKTDSVYPCVLVHCAFNATSLIVAVAVLRRRYPRPVRGVLVLLSGLAVSGHAAAAPPAVSVAATPAAGIAPLRVTLTAAGDAAAYAWDFGDGATATGAVASHVYPAGDFVATVTATSASGEVAQAQVAVRAGRRALVLEAPRSGDYGEPATFAGSLLPAVRGGRVQIYRGATHVSSARVGGNGRFRVRVLLRSPGPYHARYGPARSGMQGVTVRPRLEAALPATAAAGSSLTLRPRLVPAAAGPVVVRVLRGRRPVLTRLGAVRLPTAAAGLLRVELTTRPQAGYAPIRRVLRTQVVLPALAPGARGPSVLALERRLAELHYALRRVDAAYGADTADAVLAFQKVHGLPRTGRVEPWLWNRLARARVPRARHGGSYLEVDKTRQVLFVVRGGEVAQVLHVSTGATGNTPLGSWRVYRKVGGWDWVLWYPLYFLRGFAIHGYPSVPAYPASHGCVRVPMWIAPSLFAAHGYGARVVVHS